MSHLIFLSELLIELPNQRLEVVAAGADKHWQFLR
ncbi:hypothetical protein Nos7107_1369 [Nostoc sp. PCC 7107]|nr:hypothetical protein Nos7107_1369 [Nostoc sp. PCC 7107]